MEKIRLKLAQDGIADNWLNRKGGTEASLTLKRATVLTQWVRWPIG